METVTPDYPRGITFEQVWAALMETRKIMTENAERQAEQQAEWKKEQAKEQAERKKEQAEREKQHAKQREELEKQMKETDRILGKLGNRFGELPEYLVAPGIVERFNALGYHFDAVSPRGQEIRNEEGKVIAEVDILLENGDCIMAVEVKTRTRLKDIEHHVRRLEILRGHRNKRKDTRKIYGAIAGAVFGGEEKQATLEAGLFVLEQSGDTVKLDVPPGFVPREW